MTKIEFNIDMMPDDTLNVSVYCPRGKESLLPELQDAPLRMAGEYFTTKLLKFYKNFKKDKEGVAETLSKIAKNLTLNTGENTQVNFRKMTIKE